MTTYRQERPSWCPHQECIFKRRAMDNICGGTLPKPEAHDGVMNTHRFCTNLGEDAAVVNGQFIPEKAIVDLQVNSNDLDWFRWIFDALDGKQTSWLSKRAPANPATEREVLRQYREALEDLMAVQNGPPLLKYEADWNAAMGQARAVLTQLEALLARKEA